MAKKQKYEPVGLILKPIKEKGSFGKVLLVIAIFLVVMIIASK